MKQVRGANRIVVEKEIDQETLLRYILIMLFRLGGEQKFTAQEVHDIENLAGGITISISEDLTTLLKFRSVKSMEEVFPVK